MQEEELKKKIKKWAQLENEARSVRRRMADWDFINKQPPKIREALKYYIETGDMRRASYLAGLDIDDFREMLRKARIPIVV